MKYLFIDGNSILNRAFYGVTALSSRSGIPTNAIHGFFATYMRVFKELKPDGVTVCFDVHAPTFRHEFYPEYKAGRHPTPPELILQLKEIRSLLDLAAIPRMEKAGFEADDFLGSLSALAEKEGAEAIILTGDRDALQLVREKVTVRIATTSGGKPIIKEYTPQRLREEFGVEPEQMLEIKALMGDSSDHIPGVPGVGEKTALTLVAEYGSLDHLYQVLEEEPGKFRPALAKKLTEGKDSAYLSRRLGKINREMEIPGGLAGTVPGKMSPAFRARLTELGLYQTAQRMADLLEEACGEELVPPPEDPKPSAPVVSLPFPADYCPSIKTSFALTDDGLFVAEEEKLYTLPADAPGFVPVLERYLSSPGKKATHGLKDAFSRALRMGCRLPEDDNLFFDTLTAAALLNRKQTLPALAEELLQLSPEGKPEKLSPSEAALLTGKIAPLQAASLHGASFEKVYTDIELPLSRVLAEMEHAGFLLDQEALRLYGKKLSARAEETAGEIFALVGEEFNINSPRQLGQILFEKLALPAGRKTKSGYSTDAEVLQKLAPEYPIAEKILEYRSLTKLTGTYVEGLPRGIGSDGRIHSTFLQTGAITGRISSTEPNLQNIPVRTELGRELRKMFIAPEGYLLVDADYSQIELRLMAEIAGDEAMLETFLSGEDIHTRTASQVFDVPLIGVTPEMRSAAKAVNFGIIYGISEFALAEDLGVSRYEARDYIDKYLSGYPRVKAYRGEIVEFARKHGYVETLFGRRRVLEDIHSSRFPLRTAAERMALNAPVQGTAADIIKLAMIQLSRELKQHYPRARLILQIHDELICEAPEEEAEGVATLLRQVMENAVKTAVPLTSEAGIGKSWFDAKK